MLQGERPAARQKHPTRPWSMPDYAPDGSGASSEPAASSKVVTHADLQTMRPPPASQGSESVRWRGSSEWSSETRESRCARTRTGAPRSAARPPGAGRRSRRLRAALPRERATGVRLVLPPVVRSLAGRGADAGRLRARLAEALVSRRERVLVLALPPHGEHRALGAALAPPAHVAGLRHRRPDGLREGPAKRPRRKPASTSRRRWRRCRRARAPCSCSTTWRATDARGDRAADGHGGGHVEGAAAPGPPAAQGGTRVDDLRRARASARRLRRRRAHGRRPPARWSCTSPAAPRAASRSASCARCSPRPRRCRASSRPRATSGRRSPSRSAAAAPPGSAGLRRGCPAARAPRPPWSCSALAALVLTRRAERVRTVTMPAATPVRDDVRRRRLRRRRRCWRGRARVRAAANALLAALQRHRGAQLGRGRWRGVERNLQVIDDALAEVRAALDKDPGNARAQPHAGRHPSQEGRRAPPRGRKLSTALLRKEQEKRS